MDEPAIQGWSLQGAQFQLSQDAVSGRPSFTITDGQTFVCVAKQALMALKEHVDIYADQAATQLVLSVQQTELVSFSRGYDISTPDGQLIGRLVYQALQSAIQEHWDIYDANDVLIAQITQDTATAATGATVTMLGQLLNRFIGSGSRGNMDGQLGSLVPQSFTAKAGGRAVCLYKETMSIGTFFKMSITFPAESAGLIDQRLGVVAGIIIATRHMSTD